MSEGERGVGEKEREREKEKRYIFLFPLMKPPVLLDQGSTHKTSFILNHL